MFELLIPFTEKAFFNRINPLNRYRSIIRTAENSIDLLKNLPDYLQNILHKISNNKLKITFHHDRLEELAQGIDRASNRLSFSIIIAALIIGSSIIIQLDRGPILWGYPVFGTVGFIIASFLGIWLLIGIIRSGKL
jgi:ubiquinone biosynthesis protein